MSNTPISLFTFTSDVAKPAPTGDRIELPQGAEGFATIFAGLMQSGTGDQAVVEQTTTCPAGGLAAEFSKLLPQLLKLYANNAAEGLEVAAAGTSEGTSQTLTELTAMGNDQPAMEPGADGIELMKRLLAGIAALFAAQQQGDTEGKEAAGESQACSEKDAQAADDVQAQGESPEPEVNIAADSSESQDKGIVAIIAVLLFGYLQPVQQQSADEQIPAATPDMQAIGAQLGLGLEETVVGNTADSGRNTNAAAPGRNATQQVSQGTKDIEELLRKMMAAASETQPADTTGDNAVQVEAQLVFAKEALKQATDAPVAKNTDAKAAAPNRPSLDALLEVNGKDAEARQQETNTTIDNASETFVKAVSQLQESVDGQAQKQVETESSDQPMPKENYQVLADKDPAARGVEQKSPVQQASPVHAVEKFEKTFEQFSARTGLNEMRVRLNIGNDESVVLGLKDLGQTISVEVKASHQAIIGLLESQKDVITKHLEAKDVHTNIFIDPDSSAKQDQKDRREGKQQLRTSRSRNDAEGFAEVLEVLS